MKKIITLVCTLACILGLTACDSEVIYTEYEQKKIDDAILIAENLVVPYLVGYMDDAAVETLDKYTAKEINQLVAEDTYNQTGGMLYMDIDGNAMKNAAISFNNAAEKIGEIKEIGTATGKIDDKTIIVTVPVTGSLKNGNAEVIISNDMFYVIESASLNEESTMGDAMVKAALNTVIGMGTVFIVLILISFIIALFGYIPKIQAKIDARKKLLEDKEESIDNTIAQIAAKEEVDVTDDYELVAVIAAAIAASEGAASTDGFVVRSVRKVNRRR